MTYKEAYKNWQKWLDCRNVDLSECDKIPGCRGCEHSMIVSKELVRTSMKAISMMVEDAPIEYYEREKAVEHKEEFSLTDLIHRVCDDICVNYCKYEEFEFDSMEEDEIMKVCGKCPLSLLR